jgi:hypothetical protein
MGANVRICNQGRVNLAANDEAGASNLASVAAMIGHNPGDRLLCYAAHNLQTRLQLNGTCLELSHRRMIWLACCGNFRIAQIDEANIAQTRKMHRTG